MTKATRIISLNLGSQTIGLDEFQAQPQGGLVLQNYRLREVLIDPASEDIRHPQISAALREMMAEVQIRHEAVNYAVSAQSVFARFVKLPAVEEEKIERIIAFEAQQNVPFPIDEVVWDYQLIAGGGDEQVQVVLVAIKTDLLDEINGAVEETGLRTAIVDVATMALYNAFRYNYADLSGCSLLVDIGARTTNLLFIEPPKIFSRNIPVGGSSITAAITKEFDESFAAAEFRKKRDGFVGLGGAYAEPTDRELARVSKLMRSTMTRLHAEVMRSISHYRAQQQGNTPERVFLCGGTASAPYMREFFREKLQIPIEFFNPLRNVAVAHSAPVKELTPSAHLLGELVGLALRSVSACPMELNLRPATVLRRQALERRRPFFMMAAAGVVLALLSWGFYYTRAAQVARYGWCAAGRSDQRSIFLAGNSRRSQRASAQGRYLDHRTDPDFGRQTNRCGRETRRRNRAHAGCRCKIDNEGASGKRSDRRSSPARTLFVQPEAAGSGGRLFSEPRPLTVFQHRSEEPGARDQINDPERHRVGVSLRIAAGP